MLYITRRSWGLRIPFHAVPFPTLFKKQLRGVICLQRLRLLYAYLHIPPSCPCEVEPSKESYAYRQLKSPSTIRVLQPQPGRRGEQINIGLILAALAIDPFAQQVVRYYQCSVPMVKVNATIPTTNVYQEMGYHLGAGYNAVV